MGCLLVRCLHQEKGVGKDRSVREKRCAGQLRGENGCRLVQQLAVEDTVVLSLSLSIVLFGRVNKKKSAKKPCDLQACVMPPHMLPHPNTTG